MQLQTLVLTSAEGCHMILIKCYVELVGIPTFHGFRCVKLVAGYQAYAGAIPNL